MISFVGLKVLAQDIGDRGKMDRKLSKLRPAARRTPTKSMRQSPGAESCVPPSSLGIFRCPGLNIRGRSTAVGKPLNGTTIAFHNEAETKGSRFVRAGGVRWRSSMNAADRRSHSQGSPVWYFINPINKLDRIISDESDPRQGSRC